MTVKFKYHFTVDKFMIEASGMISERGLSPNDVEGVDFDIGGVVYPVLSNDILEL